MANLEVMHWWQSPRKEVELMIAALGRKFAGPSWNATVERYNQEFAHEVALSPLMCSPSPPIVREDA